MNLLIKAVDESKHPKEHGTKLEEQYWVQNVQEENGWGKMSEVFTFNQYWSSA